MSLISGLYSSLLLLSIFLHLHSRLLPSSCLGSTSTPFLFHLSDSIHTLENKGGFWSYGRLKLVMYSYPWVHLVEKFRAERGVELLPAIGLEVVVA